MNKWVSGNFIVEENHSTMEFDWISPITIDYNYIKWLPTATATATVTATARNLNMQLYPSINLCITLDENQNITPAKKRLLHWHSRFGYCILRDAQPIRRSPPFGFEQFLAYSKISSDNKLLCEMCQYARARRKAAHGKMTWINPASEGYLKNDHLHPGVSVSVDHFESRIKGRTFSSFWQSTSEHFVGNCVYVDHMGGYLQVEHQLGSLSTETIRVKQSYTKHCLVSGIMADTYLTDNGMFKANAFINHIREQVQRLRLCGVNDHH